MLIRVAAVGIAREVELDDVVGIAPGELGALLVVDHVIRRRDHLRERTHLAEVVMERSKWTDLGHGRGTLASHDLTHIRHLLRATRVRTAVRLGP